MGNANDKPLKFRDLQNADPPSYVPRLTERDFSFVWVSAYWDGPKSGMLLYLGQQYWFEMFRENTDDDANKWYRRFAVLALSAEQLAKEHEVHADFQRYVGTHWDSASSGDVQPSDKHHLFYDKHLEFCRTRHYDDNEVIAWFEL